VERGRCYLASGVPSPSHVSNPATLRHHLMPVLLTNLLFIVGFKRLVQLQFTFTSSSRGSLALHKKADIESRHMRDHFCFLLLSSLASAHSLPLTLASLARAHMLAMVQLMSSFIPTSRIKSLACPLLRQGVVLPGYRGYFSPSLVRVATIHIK
jgi:hypothetical protein